MEQLGGPAYDMFKKMTLRQLMDYRLVSSSNRQEVESSFIWCDRLRKQFHIMSHDDCFQTYRQAYSERREDYAEILYVKYGLCTPFCTLPIDKETQEAKGTLSMTAFTLEMALTVFNARPSVRLSMKKYTDIVRRSLLLNPSEMGLTTQMMGKFSKYFREAIVLGLLADTGNSDDVLPDQGLDFLTIAWGADPEESREYKTDYILRRQMQYLTELKDTLN